MYRIVSKLIKDFSIRFLKPMASSYAMGLELKESERHILFVLRRPDPHYLLAPLSVGNGVFYSEEDEAGDDVVRHGSPFSPTKGKFPSIFSFKRTNDSFERVACFPDVMLMPPALSPSLAGPYSLV